VPEESVKREQQTLCENIKFKLLIDEIVYNPKNHYILDL